MPLPFHKDARLAAEASLAAHAQGKFWEYHDLLFANQKALGRPALESYAQQLGLDMEKFKAALDSHQFSAAIDQDIAVAKKVGATGTPASYINGVKLSGAQPFPAFKAAIDKALGGGAAPERPVARRDGAGLGAPVSGLSTDGPSIGPAGAKDTVIAFLDLGSKESLEALAGLLALQEKNAASMRLVLRVAQAAQARRASPVGQMMAAALKQDAAKGWKALAAIAKGGDPSLRAVTAELQKAGFDPSALRGAMRDEAVLASIQADAAEARKAGFQAAPAAVINGRGYLGGKGWDVATLGALAAGDRGDAPGRPGR